MKLLEFISRLNQQPLKEGGNITLPTGETPDDLNLNVTKRSYIVPILDKLLADVNNLYSGQFKEPLWDQKLLASKKFLSGSSTHFFNLSGIPDEQFVKAKPKVGDIDTQIDADKADNLKSFLDGIQGKDLGDAKLLGYKSGNQQFSSLWELKEPPIKIQIDLEFVKFEKGEPTAWSQFSHSSDWEDLQAGIKGVFHKFLISSFGSLTKKDFLLRKMVGRGKARAEQDVPTTDNMLSFAVSSKEGGGLRPKYEPVLDDNGQPLEIDGMPVMRELPASGYEQDISKIFKALFGDRIGDKELKLVDKKLWSFVGLLDIMNMILEDSEKKAVADSFVNKLFSKGAQGLYKNDPERDSAEKSAAVNKMFEIVGKQISDAELTQMKKDYYAGYKMTGESINEAESPSYKRQGIKHIYNPGSSTEISDRDFLTLVRKIQQDLGGKLKGAKVNLKVDGAGIRFGKDESGRPFMMTSRADKPLYADDIGSFANFNKDRPEEFQQRAAKYDRALDTIVNSDFIKSLPDDTIVQAEMLYNEMAEKTKDGLKFVHIPYDPKKLGGKMTLAPFSAKVYSTGQDHPDEEKILDALVKKSTKDIKLMSNTLPTKDIDVSKIIEPAVNLTSELEATLAPRSKDSPEKQQVKEILSGVKKELSDFIINSPNISGKDQLGSNMEGLVINLPGLPPVKVTSQTMKDSLAAKKAPPPGAENQQTKTAVVALGSFVGHRGHEQLFQFVLDEAKSQGGDPFVFISQAVGKDDPIPGDMKLTTWQKLYPESSDVFSLVQDQPDGSRGSLLKKVEHELVKPKPGQLPDYNNIIIMVGADRSAMEKQASHLQNRLNKFPGYENVRVTLKTTPRAAEAGGTGVNFTAMRNVLKDPNSTEEQQLDVWMKGFNGEKLGEEWVKKLMDVSRKNMGIPSPAKPTESLDEDFNESISIDSAVKSIVATADSIAKVYGDLKTMAEKWVYNNGQLKGFHRNAAGVGKRWYDTFYWGKMENDLRTLLEKNPKGAAKLQDFFNIERDERGHISFTTIGKSLPKVLYQVGERMDSKDLQRFSRNWFNRQKDYEDFLSTVEKRINDEEEDESPAAAAAPRDNVVGRQNAAAEDIVNQILRSIDKKVAGEIRNIIAREPNKLQALQRELAKRNIKVGESTYRMKSQGVSEGDLDEDWRKKLAAAGLAASVGLGAAGGAQARVIPGQDTDLNRLTGKPAAMQQVKIDNEKLEFSTEYLLKVAKGKHPRPMIGAEKARQELERRGISVDEGWRNKLAALGAAGAMGLSGAAGAADRLSDPVKTPIIATIVIDGETKRFDLTPKGFEDVRDAESFIKKFMKDRGIIDWQGKIERGEPGSGKYQRLKIIGAGGLESIQEAPIEMDPADPMDPMIHGHDRANPGKLKYRMARAAGQLKDLASRVDGASASEWQTMTRQFEELKMNMEQIRHALEELSKIKKKGGIRSRGITV